MVKLIAAFVRAEFGVNSAAARSARLEKRATRFADPNLRSIGSVGEALVRKRHV
jgi:hypothetical protein